MTAQERQSHPEPPQSVEPAAQHLEVGVSSDTGPSRDLNEDYVDYYLPPNAAQSRLKGAIFVVADGMGGHLAGEVASKEAVKRVMEEYYADPSHDPGESLGRAISVANHLVHEHASSDPAKSGMGTTLVAAVVIGAKVYVANVGDSRAYGINENTIIQITRDHSWVEEQLEAGILTREQAQKHPQRNLITRALGTRQTVDADLFEGKLLAGDALLLCTDGVCGPLAEDEMAQAVRSLSPSRAAAQLVGQAGAQGGKDNASALVVKAIDPETWAAEHAQPPSAPADRVQPATPSSVAPQSGQRRQRWILAVVAACIVLCLIAAVVLVPALTQKLAGDPVAAPLPAPIQDSRLAGSYPDQVALYLGYADSDQMIAAHGGLLDLENLGSSDLQPAVPGVFLVGTAREWNCEQQDCSFLLDMAGTDYIVTYRVPGEKGVDLNGRPVRVYGPQQEGQSAVAAQLVERGSHWWAWWQPAWKLVHQADALDQLVWVYSIVDQNPNGLVDLDKVPGLKQGAQLLLRGLWHVEKQSMTFKEDQIYHLQGSKYVPVTGQPTPPLPTVTLQPTRAVFLDHHRGVESAGSGK
jgi:protein phosphatase